MPTRTEKYLFNQLSSEELSKWIERADTVITHGGVGSIITAILKDKKVIAVPRLKKYNEHVNDHQLDIIDSFSEMGYILGIHDVKEIDEALKKVKEFKPKKYVQNTGNIIKIIEDFIDNN